MYTLNNPFTPALNPLPNPGAYPLLNPVIDPGFNLNNNTMLLPNN
jgi:hypothetical protein